MLLNIISRMFLAILTSSSHLAFAFPHYASLGGLSSRQLANILPDLEPVIPGTPPGPLEFTGTKLVHDAAHPYIAPGEGDQRGPCPGLNTLANHGYLPRSGVATPAQIITAVQEGFNMNYDIARLAAYSAHLLNGNVVTDLLSIGGKTPATGPSPPPPAHAGGNNVHQTIEGDASLSRADAYFGDGHSFNQSIFDKFVQYCEQYGDGFWNLTVAQEYVWSRIQDSIHTNPEFDIANARYPAIYGTSAFLLAFFVDGRINTPRLAGRLSVENATLIMRDGRYPDDFWRAPAPAGNEGGLEIFNAHPVGPGKNVGGVDQFAEDPNSPVKSVIDVCGMYKWFVDSAVKLYPEPEGVLRRNLIINFKYLWEPVAPLGCPEIAPYGTA